MCDAECVVRSIGGALQLIGVVLIWVGVRRTSSQLGRESRWAKIKSRASRLFGRTPAPQAVAPEAFGGSTTPVGDLAVRKMRGWEQLVDQEKIERLRRDIEKHRQEAEDMTQHLKMRIKGVNERVDEVEHHVGRKLLDLTQNVDELAGGNLRLTIWGAVAFFLGVLLATWAPELTQF